VNSYRSEVQDCRPIHHFRGRRKYNCVPAGISTGFGESGIS